MRVEVRSDADLKHVSEWRNFQSEKSDAIRSVERAERVAS